MIKNKRQKKEKRPEKFSLSSLLIILACIFALGLLLDYKLKEQKKIETGGTHFY
jgi:hypothetical protein